ncbi:hypothetical protein YPPY66_3308 [Yersinia pestis PY-66]|nr:hypothetical protein YPPY48_3090 [Yersinia pestis PY-48]EIS22366.1 hypothetical protein YPPY54_3136 [Yersinia pestis PY-54]EIS30727.1 hypothetical protein YPPY56_3102 [Yersinia pestis PY-56]EIS72005.1 hypothetical protein YPPY66_3308 [Yersinia pestis PY-66]EIS93853.1 hypothetical protein YPPY89_3265 [Yersinia pestis PY-89]EIT14853.1 hypothetical protein YPPY94_3055 [Yersinia pestis PY-94]
MCSNLTVRNHMKKFLFDITFEVRCLSPPQLTDFALKTLSG